MSYIESNKKLLCKTALAFLHNAKITLCIVTWFVFSIIKGSENMAVTKKDVEYVAQLAKLEFTEGEKERLIGDLNNIIGYVDKLTELNTDNVDIVVNPYYIENKFREDVVTPSLDLEKVIESAPKTLEEYVVVPKIIDE